MSDPVLAAPSGECCLKTVQHKGTAAGTSETIFDINTYVTGAKPGGSGSGVADRILFYFADVHGPFYINGQLVADYFASRGMYDCSLNLFIRRSRHTYWIVGWLVLAPDYFSGDPVWVCP